MPKPLCFCLLRGADSARLAEQGVAGSKCQARFWAASVFI